MEQLHTTAIGADAASAAGSVMSFSFGDPETVLNNRGMLLELLECPNNGRWHEPPVSLDGLARVFRVGPHHASAINLKRNLVTASFIPSRWMDRATFGKLVQDYLVFGNGYVRRVDNLLRSPLKLAHEPAKYVRRGVEPDRFHWVPGSTAEVPYDKGTVCQLMQSDINQEIYGVPEYLSALQSALLNEASTLFRRKYFDNGSHAGYILYATGEFVEGDLTKLKEQLKQAKGPGNFRNLFIHAPQGKENGIQIKPIAEVGAKDEFLGIKNTTRDDVLAAHRVPPQLLGIVPANAGGFGDIGKATDAFHRTEIEPLQSIFLQINDWMGYEVISFRKYEPMSVTPAAAA
jgi:PBSX family phage portal protein